jgi:hypothetical protein
MPNEFIFANKGYSMGLRTTFKFLFLTALIAFWISGGRLGPTLGPEKLQAAPLLDNGVIVYQFHRRFRCEACYKLEETINETLQTHFQEELKTGKLVFRVHDLDEEGMIQYEKKYEFFYNTVIVVDMDEGKETRFKNLEEVWSLVDDKDTAIEFIRSEIADYL